MNYFSQYKQDFIIDKIIQQKRGGTFVDIGAHNGIIFSNTYFLEKERNWSGVCIEPIPELFNELKQNRKCKIISGCVSNKKGVMKFLRITGKHNMLSGLKESMDAEHLKRITKDTKAHGGEIIEIDIKCYILNDILAENKLYNIDYCSIDTEGAELDILKSIDFDQFYIKIFSIENSEISMEIRNLMKSKGYKLLCVPGVDEIYIKRDKIDFSMFLLRYNIFGFFKRNRITTRLRLLKRYLLN